MAEELYFASDKINGIKLDVVLSTVGLRKILINKNLEAEELSGLQNVPSNDPEFINIFNQLQRIF